MATHGVGDRRFSLTWPDLNDVLNRVAVFAENSVETLLAHLGGLLAGVSTVPVNFHLNAVELDYILTDSDATVLFVGPMYHTGPLSVFRIPASKATSTSKTQPGEASCTPAIPHFDIERSDARRLSALHLVFSASPNNSTSES